MEGIVLAGGFGTRLRQVVPDLPKPMAPIAGRPFLEILLASLAKKGFRRMVLSVGYLSDKIIDHFGDRFSGMDLIYDIETIPLGTGGAILQSLKKCVSDHVYVFNGDTYLDLETRDVESFWKQRQTAIIVAREVPDTARYGRLEIDRGRVCRFCEKGVEGPGLINAGCYILPKHIFDGYSLGHVFSLETDFFAHAVPRLHLEVFVSHGQFIDIGIPLDYARAQLELANV